MGERAAGGGISFLLVPVVAWITVWGRGNVAPIGFALAMLALGNLFGKTGWAEWFPWSIVPLLIGMVSDPCRRCRAGSYVVLALTFVAGVAAHHRCSCGTRTTRSRDAHQAQRHGPPQSQHRHRGAQSVGPGTKMTSGHAACARTSAEQSLASSWRAKAGATAS